jgi:uncharacterized protein YfiM (DUF2279 family)
MRYLIIVSVFLGLLPAAAMDLCKIDSVALISIKAKNTDNWFGKDKGDHFTTSAFLIGAGYYFSKQEMKMKDKSAQYNAVAFSFSLGVLKEIYDKKIKKTHFCFKDLVADLAGIGFGIAVLNLSNH